MVRYIHDICTNLQVFMCNFILNFCYQDISLVSFLVCLGETLLSL